MKSAAKFLFSLFLLMSGSLALAQTSSSKTPGAISGRITAGSEPAAGIEVIMKPGGSASVADFLQSGPAITATTDSDGWFKFASVAPGSYRLVAYAPAHIIEGEANPLTPGKVINIGEGETIENISFSITRGGIVTGRVTDPDNRPVIAEAVRAYKLDANGKRASSGIPVFNEWQTDDRGVYRIYGLEPGKYIVAAGASSEDASLRIGGAGGTYYRRTFYPEAVEEAEAKIIEIRSGTESEGIDIKLAPASKSKTFTVTGRVIEADTNKPVAGVMIGYGVTKQGSVSFGFGNSATNSAGEFRLEGLTPNAYNAFIIGIDSSENYGEQANFEITNSDVSGIEIKMYTGGSISGVAAIEGSADPKLREKLASVSVFTRPLGDEQQMVFSNITGGTTRIAANGTFKIGGIRPGKVQLMANTMMAEKGFSLLRVEHNGAEVRELQVSAGERLTGVRLVFAYGTASIAGRVEIRGGALPAGVRLMVRARREGGGDDSFSFGAGNAEVDTRGQFMLEGLSAGTYRVTLFAPSFNAGTTGFKLPKVEQTVSVSNSGRQDVLLVVDLSKEER